MYVRIPIEDTCYGSTKCSMKAGLIGIYGRRFEAKKEEKGKGEREEREILSVIWPVLRVRACTGEMWLVLWLALVAAVRA